jgi:hypothetical protein
VNAISRRAFRITDIRTFMGFYLFENMSVILHTPHDVIIR